VLPGDCEIAVREIDLDGGPVVAPVRPGHIATATPLVRWYSDQVEKRPDVFRREMEKQL
jgi:hypothetical protein